MMQIVVIREWCQLEQFTWSIRWISWRFRGFLHKSKPYLQTPVKRVAYTNELPNADMFRYSYDSAMSHYSFLAQPR
jgi:hypothetical protein